MKKNFKMIVQDSGGLTVPFAILCIIDLFGIFPIVVLPGPIIKCGMYNRTKNNVSRAYAILSNNQCVSLTGWAGIPLAISVFAVQVYTAILLGKCWIMAEEIEPSIVKKNR